MHKPDAATTWQRPKRPDTAERERPTTAYEGRQLGRFRLDTLIGEGGMGRVYEAFDLRLRRVVAVKLLRNVDSVSVRRFVREARTQAGVAHAGICPIFEAGEVDGTPYIVMRRLHGRSLDRAAEGLSLEQRALLVRQVAEAVHAAHREGLVHRDLKPANILVEPSAEGTPSPIVLDFGLARPATSDPGLTRVGAWVGTPAYMAPEQARGGMAKVDRRTDIFALGATLYRILAGRAPFTGDSATTLVQMLTDEPPPLRPFGVPADLEAIVFQCLEKNPEHRYGSARALAEDLDRFLDGKPVHARPAGRGYRLRKWLLRHRAIASVATVATALLLVALGWNLWSAHQARERERLVRAFTEQAEEVEATVRYSHLSPLHDVRADRDRLRQRMDAIRQAIDRAGSLGRGPGRYALGRGHLALDELELAREQLSAAWGDGYRTSDVAAALGQTLSAIYRQQLASVELVRDWETRQRLQDDLERRYGDPARFFLTRAAPDDSTPFLEALLPFHEEAFEEALAVLADHPDRQAWDFELHQLEGDIRRTWAMALAASDALDRAREQLRLAHAAYQRATTIAPSAPALYRATAQTAFQRLSLDGSTGRDLETFLRAGIDATGRALAADPRDGRAWLWQARLYRAAARELHNRSEDPTAELIQAVAAGKRATGLLATPSLAWRELGRTQSGWSRWLDERGEDSAHRLQQANDALDRVAPADRDYEYFVFLGQVRRNLADRRALEGSPAQQAYAGAIDAYRAATTLHSEPFAAWVNLGSSYLAAAALPGAENPATILERSRDALQAAQDLRPDHVVPPYYLGRVILQLAQGGRTGSVVSDKGLAQRAITHYQRALALAPDMFQVHGGLGQVFHMLALHAWDSGQDPAPHFARAKAAYRRAGELAPKNALPWLNLAWSEYFEAKFLLRGEGHLGNSLDAALRHAQRAWDLSNDPFALLCLGNAHRLRAEHALRVGNDPTRPFAAAEQVLAQSLERNPTLAEGHRSLARLYTLEIRWRHRRDRSTATAQERARAALDRALELEPGIALFWLADARWALSIPPSQRKPSALARGLAGARRALTLRPEWPEAIAARGALLAARGDHDQATVDLQHAVDANTHLAFEWRQGSMLTDRR